MSLNRMRHPNLSRNDLSFPPYDHKRNSPCQQLIRSVLAV